MPTRFLCPNCQTQVDLEANGGGDEIRCPKCTQRIRTSSAWEEVLTELNPAIPEAMRDIPDPSIERFQEQPLKSTVKKEHRDPFDFNSPLPEGEYEEPEPVETFKPIAKPRRKRSDSVTMVGTVKLLYGLMFLIMGCISFSTSNLFQEEKRFNIDDEDKAEIRMFFLAVGIMEVLYGLLNMIAAYGIRKRRPWGATLGIILGILDGILGVAFSFLKVPCYPIISGICCVYCLAVLLDTRHAQEFR